ncbi:hypothetical protein [Neobacillus sp. D3-1R]|uniref:hypothetical protein n=1 Tax=Neobacillus sp. D3-1R TaxID=3445778 RepID=UPI003FA05742
MKSKKNDLEEIIGEGYSYRRSTRKPIILPPPLKGNDYQRMSLKNKKHKSDNISKDDDHKVLAIEEDTQNDKGYFELTSSIYEVLESSSDRLDESSYLLETDESSSSPEESSSNNDFTLDKELVNKFSYMLDSESSHIESSSFYESDSIYESSSYSEESSYHDESDSLDESSSYFDESSGKDESDSLYESSPYSEESSDQDESDSLDESSSYPEESSCQDESESLNESSSEESSCQDESDSLSESSSEVFLCQDESDSLSESSSEVFPCQDESDSSNESSSYSKELDCSQDESSLETDSTLPIVKIPVVLGLLNLDLDIYNTINLSIPIANIVNIDWSLKSFDCKVLLPSPNVFLKGELIGEIEYIKENDENSLHLTKIRIPWDKVTEIDWLHCPDLPSSHQAEYMFKSKDDKEIQIVRECHNQFACPIYPEIHHIHITWHDELLSKTSQKELDVQGRVLLAINLLQSQYVSL